MRKAERLRLMKKFRVRAMGAGDWGAGFLNGLQWTEKKRSKVPLRDDEVQIPILRGDRQIGKQVDE